MPTRRILRLSGSDAERFLQDLVTNDLSGPDDRLVYAALLTPQGKYLADFFLKRDGDTVLLDVADDLADGLAKRLAMYKLRADVT
ncbi:MAG: folate-binding protein, partial [Pseudomonadota bacterium]